MCLLAGSSLPFRKFHFEVCYLEVSDTIAML